VPPPATLAATDNCGAPVTVSYNGQTITPGPCTDAYTITRTWTATDNCNNTKTISQTISVVDTQKPNFTSVPPNTTIHCTDPLPPLGNPTATDNCSPYVHITFLGSTPSGSGCSTTYTITRTWKADDLCGNSATASQLITVLATPLDQPNAERSNAHAHAANGYLNAFSNPTTGTLWIACAVPNPPAHLRLFNAQGQLLWERHLDEPDTHQLIPISLREIGAAAGHYTLQLHGDRHTATQRIVLIDQP